MKNLPLGIVHAPINNSPYFKDNGSINNAPPMPENVLLADPDDLPIMTDDGIFLIADVP